MPGAVATPTITIDPEAIDAGLIAIAAARLREGGLVAIPTETVYGLGCNALDQRAVAGVFEAKGRPATDPLIVHVDGLAMAETVVSDRLSPTARALADAFWPGPLTLVLPKATAVPDAITSGGPTVGVRCPAHPVAAAIITAAGVPVAAPSANRFGRISPTSATHVAEELSGRIDLIVDAGRSEHGLESTVVLVDGERTVILRHGAITREALAAIVDVEEVGDDVDARAAAPGHEIRHYSPRTPTLATATAPTPDSPAGRVIFAGYHSSDRPPLPDDWTFEPLGTRSDLGTVGHDLYDTLRRLDDLGPDLIVVELTGAGGIGRAIDDRLTRAASGTVALDSAALDHHVARLLAR